MVFDDKHIATHNLVLLEMIGLIRDKTHLTRFENLKRP